MQNLENIIKLFLSLKNSLSIQFGRDFRELVQLQSSINSQDRFVANGLKIIEQQTIRELHKAKPEYGLIISGREEIEHSEKYNFIINPISDIFAFSRAFPDFSYSICFESLLVNPKETLASMIYLPALDQTLVASKGSGSWFVDESTGRTLKTRLRVSAKKDRNKLMSVVSDLSLTTNIPEACINYRIFGSISTCIAYVSMGKADFAIIKEPSNKSEEAELMTSSLILKESGGSMVQKDGILICGNSDNLP